MNGWISVAIMVLAQIAAAALLVRGTARRWWDYPLITVLTVALVPPSTNYLTGDVSRYLPAAIWSDGSEGKDQIILASAASTILLALIASAITVYVVRQAWRALQNSLERKAR